jgi:hypothetical protein
MDWTCAEKQFQRDPTLGFVVPCRRRPGPWTIRCQGRTRKARFLSMPIPNVPRFILEHPWVPSKSAREVDPAARSTHAGAMDWNARDRRAFLLQYRKKSESDPVSRARPLFGLRARVGGLDVFSICFSKTAPSTATPDDPTPIWRASRYKLEAQASEFPDSPGHSRGPPPIDSLACASSLYPAPGVARCGPLENCRVLSRDPAGGFGLPSANGGAAVVWFCGNMRSPSEANFVDPPSERGRMRAFLAAVEKTDG